MNQALATITTDARRRVQGMIEQGVTIEKLVVEAGVARRPLQAWLDGQNGAANDIAGKVEAWLEELDRAETAADAEIDWVETPTAQRITEALDFARTQPSMALVYGSSGLGKSVTAKRYAETTRNAAYVMASEFLKSPTGVLYSLADALGVYGHAYRTFELAQKVKQALLSNTRAGVGAPLIIIDEAQHLSHAALDAVRWFFDDGGIGVAYLGNDAVYTRISRGANRAKFAQLHSRVGMFVHLDRPSEKDTDDILAAWGVRGREERKYAHMIANQPGGLRNLKHVLAQARKVAGLRKCPIDQRLMQAVADTLGRGL